MQRKRISDITLTAILAALTTIATRILQIPTPATGGYLNMGDVVLLASALLLGARQGALIGGIGSALADLIGGYGLYVPITLVVKGLEGLIAGLVGKNLNKKGSIALQILGSVVGGIIMVSGYYVSEQFLLKKAAIASVIPNAVQALVGIVGGVVLARAIAAAMKGRRGKQRE